MFDKKNKYNTKRFNLFDGYNYIFMFLFSLTIIYPFVNLLAISLSEPGTSTTLGFYIWPQKISYSSYNILLRQNELYTGYLNTIFRTVVGTITSVLAMAIAAYPMSRKDMPFRNIFTTLIVFTMFFSGGLIPNYLLIKNLHLINNRLVYIIPSLLNTWSLLIIRNYYMSLPKSLEESARIDGANDLKVILGIIIPISTPVIATVALWQAVWHWNSWFDSMIYVRESSKLVVQVYLRRIIREITTGELEKMVSAVAIQSDFEIRQPTASGVTSAAVLIITFPILCVYPFIQKYFVKGIMVGSLKG